MTHMTFAPGTLRQRLRERSEQASVCGALQHLASESEYIEDHGVRFHVRVLANLARKEAARREQDREQISTGVLTDPFLPPEPELVVAGLSPTHVCILNKFNVVAHHLLIVTRDFEPQQTLLSLEDFEALRTCLAELDGLGFYNAGRLAGASQEHKHLQMVPLPLGVGDDGEAIPIEPLLSNVPPGATPTSATALPFCNLLVRIDAFHDAAATTLVHNMHERYLALVDAAGLAHGILHDRHTTTAPYNLLVTRRWMLLIPRSEESMHGIGVNALGFAGAMLARDRRELARLRRLGPMNVLRGVSLPPCRPRGAR